VTASYASQPGGPRELAEGCPTLAIVGSKQYFKYIKIYLYIISQISYTFYLVIIYGYISDYYSKLF